MARHDKTAEREGETGGSGRVDGWASWAGIPFGTRNASTRDPSGRHRRSQLSTHPTLNCLLTPVPPNAASRSSIGVPCHVGLSPPSRLRDHGLLQFVQSVDGCLFRRTRW